ncbi:membrane protein [Ureibacillus massiliensis 4400831 = CIP 108448 = CCUG 49529]|uniref:Membrane protein n=1 Tax=Ureibacillus massiliensis 4400831 = CIP 108448 = CCUG 49529 TaxID=1211035 RepID=A0A0A3IT35_9BACL|nr:hypothetical protein [Ureibacillus massiliensis]KGR86048.1 membrane protein [Ureibacillus massiliensis 4400831 = CIP 108448 = CCUG 49529]
MVLINIYIQEVTRRLPEKNREDIALELRSTIEDMLPNDYNEEDVYAVLEKLGNPVALANGYRDQPTHLIGPRYFDIYITLLKLILPIVIVISLISMFIEYLTGITEEGAFINVIIDVFSFGVWKIIETGIHVFFWITVVFAILERTDTDKGAQPLTISLEKWTPDDLKNVTYIPKKKAISKVEVFGSLMWTAIWGTVYFNANHLMGVYEGGNGRLEFVMPALNQEVLVQYWLLIVISIGFEIALAIYKLMKRQWTKALAIWNAILQLFASILFVVIISNPNLMEKEFISYMMNLFSITDVQLKGWIIYGGIFIFIVSAAISAYDGFRKARAS